MVVRKSALAAKIEAVVEEYGGDAEKMKAKLASLEQEVSDANLNHESRLEEKTKTLQENIKYYGSKT